MTYIDINSMSEKDQIAIVNENGYDINDIDNPSEKVQLAAVNEYCYAIRFIKTPTMKVQLAAVKENGRVIEYIKNPSEKVQLAALENIWTKYFYEEYIKPLPNKTEWFYRELNRLKLIKGPLK